MQGRGGSCDHACACVLQDVRTDDRFFSYMSGNGGRMTWVVCGSWVMCMSCLHARQDRTAAGRSNRCQMPRVCLCDMRVEKFLRIFYLRYFADFVNSTCNRFLVRLRCLGPRQIVGEFKPL